MIFPGQALGHGIFFSVVAYRPQTLGEVPTLCRPSPGGHEAIPKHSEQHRQAAHASRQGLAETSSALRVNFAFADKKWAEASCKAPALLAATGLSAGD